MNRLMVLIWVLAIIACGCVTIPEPLMVENRLGKLDSLSADDLCNPEIRTSAQFSAPVATKGLNASGFSLVSWNIQKENRSGWEGDLGRLSQNADILIIQEAYLTEKLKRVLNRRPYYWYLVTAFEYQDTKAGVLTAATIEPDFICPLRATEPLIRVPKTIIITRYPLSDTPHALMIANVHMINFAPNQTAFIDQAQRMEEILAAHPGPMILCGDFNTWNTQRLAIINDMVARLKLEPVDFKSELGRKVFGYTVDRVYYRGLTLEKARVVEATSSDHNPLQVRFRLNQDG